MLAKWESNKLIFIDGDMRSDASINLELGDLTDGDYLLFVRPKWESQHTYRTVVAAMHANEEVEVRRVTW